MAANDAEFTPTGRTSEHYTLLKRIASGGMGRVDLAYRQQGSFHRLYAIKRLHEHFRDDADVRTMFLEEARIAGLLRHPNVVGVLDVGENEMGPYLIMDYVEGLPLSSMIRLVGTRGELVPVQIGVRIIADTARGLHAAHQLSDQHNAPLNLVHRDVSPQNVLVSWEGDVRITDFGVAKSLGGDVRTSTGVLKGKISYMSPEQLRFRKLDRRSDLFSLGVVLYELLAGERLYRNVGDNDGIRRILEESPPDLGEVRMDVPPSLVALAFELLAKDPEDRPETAGIVAGRLESILVELLATEPRIEIGEWLESVARVERAAAKVELDEAIRQATALERAIVLEPDPAAERGRVPWRRGRYVAAGVGVLCLALAAAYAFRYDPPEPNSSAELAPNEPNASVELGPGERTPGGPSPDERSEPPDVDSVGQPPIVQAIVGPDDGDDADDPVPASATTTMRRRRATMRASTAMDSKSLSSRFLRLD